jgi:hypothetical protein
LVRSGGLRYVGYYIAAAGLISLLALMPIWTVED